jgi:hypothetical protein
MTHSNLFITLIGAILILSPIAEAEEALYPNCQQVDCTDKKSVLAAAIKVQSRIQAVDPTDYERMGHLVASLSDQCLAGIINIAEIDEAIFSRVIIPWHACQFGLSVMNKNKPRLLGKYQKSNLTVKSDLK